MKALKDKINEGFFDNIGGKELIFLKDLKDTLDRWKTSFDKDFPVNQLERLCYKAQRENFNFDICIENNSSPKNQVLQYATLIKFWNEILIYSNIIILIIIVYSCTHIQCST